MGVNALQTMLPILEMIFGQGSERLPSHPDLGKASITVTNLVCRPGALSVTPDECEISVDRRYLPGETLETIQQQFVASLATIKAKYPDLDASVRVRTFIETSYTGYRKTVTKHHPVWILERDNRYVQETIRALQLVGQDAKIDYKMAGTDASMTAGVLGIPTIIFSWARAELCHKANEYMSVKRITMTLEAYAAILCRIYGIDLAQLG
jgi:acetylornithine deacetylase/succinyl-diaminopimelate desuccinylase-like protein